jgi:hypothetical protein
VSVRAYWNIRCSSAFFSGQPQWCDAMSLGRLTLAAIILVLPSSLPAVGSPLERMPSVMSIGRANDIETVRWRYGRGYFFWGRRGNDDIESLLGRAVPRVATPQAPVTEGRGRRWVDPPPE